MCLREWLDYSIQTAMVTIATVSLDTLSLSFKVVMISRVVLLIKLIIMSPSVTRTRDRMSRAENLPVVFSLTKSTETWPVFLPSSLSSPLLPFLPPPTLHCTNWNMPTLFLSSLLPTPFFSLLPLPCTPVLLLCSHEKNHKVLEHLLGALNVFSAVAAVNARGRLCKLGEDIFLHILQLWRMCQPSLKDQIVEFLRIQMRVHHPRGTHTDEEGAWATNDHLWKVRRLELACL